MTSEETINDVPSDNPPDNSPDPTTIAYCGLCCADCSGHNGRIPDLARDLRKELRQARYEKFAGFISTTPFGKAYRDYDKCYDVLGAMVKFRCRRGCRGGGGNPSCKIRNCCGKKEIEGCWECGDFESCGKLEFLEAVHGDAHIANLRKIRGKGMDGFLEGKSLWYRKKKEKKK